MLPNIVYWLIKICYNLLIPKKRRMNMAERMDLSSAYRKLKSPNIKTRKRALKVIHEHKRQNKK